MNRVFVYCVAPSVNLVAGLQSYFRDGRMLTATELRRVTEIFTKMFMDAHTKVETPFFFYARDHREA
jgi:hypothetical protein